MFPEVQHPPLCWEHLRNELTPCWKRKRAGHSMGLNPPWGRVQGGNDSLEHSL